MIERVATDPKIGDVVILRGGHVRYVVRREPWLTTVATGERLAMALLTMRTNREGVEAYVSMDLTAWTDLVRFGASTVEER